MRIFHPESEQNEKHWHDWFAWYPVRLTDGSICWLEVVRRRRIINAHDYHWEYEGWEGPYVRAFGSTRWKLYKDKSVD